MLKSYSRNQQARDRGQINAMPRKSFPWRWLILTMLVIAATAAAYWLLGRPAAVTSVKPSRGEAVEIVYATGFVEPDQPVEVSARVTAPITQILADEGQRVLRGQPLAQLDAAEQRETIAQLAAQTANTAATQARTVELFRRGFSTAAARDNAMAAARAAKAAEQAARARLDHYTLRAGINGVVLRRDAEPGDLAAPTRTLFVLGDPATLKVTATVDERDIPRVRTGQQALMSSDAFPNRICRGTVRDVTPGGDPNQRAFRVYILPRACPELPVGLTLEVNIVTRRKAGALLVPATAVRNGAVWTVRDRHVWRTEVATGIAAGDRVEILRGLDADSCIVADPKDDLAEGDRVQTDGCG